MKNTAILILLFFVLPLSIVAQGLDTPKTEFAFLAKETKVQVNRGNSTSLNLQLLKSKSFQKSTAKFGVASPLPKGMAIQYTPAEGIVDETMVKVTATDEVQPGEYQILLNCTVQRKTKGIVIKVNVL